MTRKAMLIDYQWCTGCHTCEVACQMEYGFAPEQSGIVVNEVGPWKISEDVWQYDDVPHLSRQCTLCASRLEVGKKAACEQHCQTRCIKVGDIDELKEAAEGKPTQVLIIP